MTAEVVWWDLHCHTLLKSNLSWDFLRACQSTAVSLRAHGLSLVTSPLLCSAWLSGCYATCPGDQEKLKEPEGWLQKTTFYVLHKKTCLPLCLQFV